MKNVYIVVPEGQVVLSSITGTYEILTRANSLWQRKGHAPVLNVQIGGYTRELKLDGGFFSVRPVNIRKAMGADLVIVPSLGHDYDHILRANRPLVKWISERYKNGAEVASICTGAFLLGAAGMLDGRVCSTHWNAAARFQKLFPKADLRVDQLVVSEDGVYTNGGAYSFLNLVLVLVEKYFDRDTAISCSKIFQIEFDRSSQSIFHVFDVQKNHGDRVVEKAQAYIEQNIAERISFEELASTLAVSRRNFDRRFVRATGNSPVEYLQRVKVEVAKKALENGRKTIAEVMMDVGYSDDKAFREVFRKIVGLSPVEYKERFSRRSSVRQRP